MGPGRKICLDPNGRNTKQVVLKDFKRCLARNLHIFAPMGRHVGQCKNRQPIFSFIHPTPCVRWGGGGG